jgi:hypothetical protein
MGEMYGTCGHLIDKAIVVYIKNYSHPYPSISSCVLCEKCRKRLKKKEFFYSYYDAEEWLRCQELNSII